MKPRKKCLLHSKSVFAFIVMMFLNYEALAENKKIKIAVSEDYPPWAWGQQNDVHGLSVDLLRDLLVKELKYDISMKGLPWARAQQETFAGKFDILFTVKSSERLKYMMPSKEPFFSSVVRVFIKNSPAAISKFKDIKNLADLNKSSLVVNVYLGAGWSLAHLLQKNIEYSTSLENSLIKLATGHGDAVLDNILVTRMAIKKLGLTKEIKELPIDVGQMNFYLLVRRNSEIIKEMDRIDQAFEKYRKTPAYKNLIKKYLN